jgi:pilus assembly protein Flp/PilA
VFFVFNLLQFLAGRARREERGAALIEYAFLVSLIAVVCIVAVQFLGTSVSANFSASGSSVGAAH